MKTITLNLIKKNRVYFKAETDSGYTVKLKINTNSENLELGRQELLVNDISVRSKYGVDVIYEVAAKREEGICTLKHFKYNEKLVERCRALGGRWDGEEKAWIFNSIVEDEVYKLEELYNSELVNVEITAKDDLSNWHQPVYFLGYSIARATGRDSGAILGDGVSLISGSIDSCGSVKNWCSCVEAQSVLRLQVPLKLLTESEQNDFEVRILSE